MVIFLKEEHENQKDLFIIFQRTLFPHEKLRVRWILLFAHSEIQRAHSLGYRTFVWCFCYWKMTKVKNENEQLILRSDSLQIEPVHLF